MNPAEVIMKKQQERDTLRNVVAQWNANRLDLFELSEPNEELEFHGVMRFYFQDSGQKVATKCIRVASDATSQAVIETLIEKFRPDMRMLSVPEYALYEIHENGDERRLGVDEKPLLVQLNWHIDDREGRFLLRRIDDVTNMPSVSFQEGGSSFRRKLSKREKKQLKKQEKLNKLKTTAVPDENDAGVAEKLYTELPETSFTRSISNPEAVMRRRRQQKLERKLQQFRSKDGGPDTGGTLKIYGEALCRDVPYKTLLLSVRDSAQQVVREMLAKYGLEKEQDPHNFCLVQVNTAIPVENGESKEYHGGTTNREYILDDDECPLAILMNHPSSRGSIMFHVRRRPADYHPRKRKKKLQGKWSKGSDLQEYRYEDSTGYNNLPFFLELNPDGSDIPTGTPKRHRLHPNVTEVGSERPNNQSQATQQQQNQSRSLQLFGPNIQPRHCVIGHTAGIVTVTPCSREAETYVNSQRVYETTILQNGAVVKFGRIHVFRFLDPNHDPDRTRQRHDSARQNLDFSYDRQSSRGDNEASGQQPSPNASTQNYETTFDVDGNVETVSTSSLKEETRSQRSVSSSNGNRLSNYERYPRGTDPILPAVLEFREETEEAFLHAIITDLDPSAPSFKLAPAYCLYLVARYRASTHYRPELTPTERAHRLTGLLARVAAIVHNVIQERYTDAKLLAFWMANSSELLHFLKCDRHISAFSLDAQDILAECVEISFRNLVSCLQGDLAAVMPHFMAKEDQSEEQQDSTGSVLQVLTLAMALLRRCRVNAALTIQLFSQLFHFINMWAFNKVVTSTSPGVCYCTRAWGLRLKTKLAQLEVWAERQGLELAADCHLARIIQAAHLLQAPKYSPEDLATLSSTCFKLNSLQLRALLSKYQPTADEPRLPHELIENVVRVAENVADELARSDGREIRLEEETELQLPFLLPEDGYSCDVVRGVPQGLAEFLAPLQHAGLCRMSGQPTSSGLWTIYMHQPQNPAMARSPSAMSNRSGGFPPGQLQEPELQVIRLNKSNNGMGLSIVAAKGAGQDRLGIYIKSVVKGGAADADGQLQAGDQLLKVDGQSLVGITQERAAEYLVRTGPTVTLEVAKQGAIYHGLATLLQQPSPVMARASPAARSRPKSELLQPPPSPLPSSLSLSNLRPSQHQTPPPAFEERLVDWDAQPGRRSLHSDAFSRRPDSPTTSYHTSNVLLLDPRQLVPYVRSSSLLHDTYPHDQQLDKRLQPQKPSNSPFYLPIQTSDGVNPYSQPGTSFHTRPTSLQIAGQSHQRLHPINQLKVGPYPYQKTPTHLAPSTHSFQIPHISVESFNPVASNFVNSPNCERRSSVYGNNSPNCDRRKCRDEKFVGSSFCGANINMPSPMEIFKLGPKSEFETVEFEEPRSREAGSRKYTKLNLDSNQNTIGNTYGIFKSAENVLETDNSSASSPVSSGSTSSACCCSNATDSPADRQDKLNKFLDVDEILLDELPTTFECCECPKVETRDSFVRSMLDSGSGGNSTDSDDSTLERSVLHLDLSGLEEPDRPERCWKSPEEVRLGSGRVAALARHFSLLGGGGLIRVHRSESDVSPRVEPNPFNVVYALGLKAMSFSMDRLLLKDGSHGPTVTDVTDRSGSLNRDIDNVILKLRELTEREEDSNGTENPSEVPRFLQKHKNGILRDSIEKQDLSKCHKCSSRKKKRAHKSCENLSKIDESISNSLLHTRSLDKLTDLEKLKDVNENRLHKNLDFQRVVDISQDIIDGIHFQKPLMKNCIECKAGVGLNYLRKNGCKSLTELNRISLTNLDKSNTYKSFEDNACEWRSEEEINSNRRKVTGEDVSKLPVYMDERASNSEDNILTSRLQQIIKKNKIYAVRSILKSSRASDDDPVRPRSDGDLRRPTADEGRRRSSSEPRVKFRSHRRRPGASPAVGPDFNEYLEQKYRFPLRSDVGLVTRPRRMSERDLPSRVLSEQNHNGDSRRSLNTHAPIQSSKSVPALNSGNNDLVMTSTPATHPSAAKHEVFNPGYSRTSSTNSIPQQAGLRSKSSQNLSDPRGVNPQLPPTGLGSRQSSNPSLHHPPYAPTHAHPGTQSNQHPGHSGGQVGSGQQPNGEGERFYQNLSIYRNQEIHNGYPPPSPNRGKLPSPQAHDDRSPATAQVKGLRGSQSSLHNPPPNPANASSLRPASAYLPPSNSPAGYNGPQQMAARSQSTRDIGQEAPQGYSPQQMTARSQSSRDIMRQEAKLHEMQEEVRRREMRGVLSPQQPGPPPHIRPQMPAHLQQRVPNTTYPYSQDPNHPFPGPTPQYNGQRPPLAYAPPTAPKPVRHPSEPALNRPPNAYEQYRPQHGDLRHPPSEQYRPQMGPLPHTQNEQYRPHLVQQQELLRAQVENRVGFSPQYATDGPNRPQMPHEEAGYRESPPPPPPPTATHPLYQQKPAPLAGPQPDVRYSASSGEAPRGGFYPASPSSGGPPRQPFPFNNVATSPWEREEREKDQQRRREAARAWRDQQINELSSLAQRTAQQEEQLRALRLEREFQRRAEEAAKLEEEEEGEEEQESVERVQGLLRMATATQNTPPKHPHILQNGRPNQPLSQPPRPPVVEDKERMRKVEEMRREQELKREHEMRRDQEIKREQEANKRREEEIRHHQQQLLQQQQQQQQMLQQQQLIQQQQQQQQQLKENFMASTQQNQSSALLRQPNNINGQFPTKPTNPSHLRLDNLVINGPSSPTTQYNGYNGSYQPEHKTVHGEGILKSPPQSPTESGAARLDSLLGVGERISQAPLPPERGSSFAITQAVTQGVLRGGRESSGVGTATVKRVSFSDPNANNQSMSPGGGQPMERIREDPNHFINEAETLLASPKSPDGSPFANNTPGVIGSQEVYKDPRARLLAAQQKLQLTRSGPLPEKLSFKEKMKMFAMETGEDGTPRDKVKISRAQRDIDNLAGSPTSPLSPNNNQ